MGETVTKDVKKLGLEEKKPRNWIGSVWSYNI